MSNFSMYACIYDDDDGDDDYFEVHSNIDKFILYVDRKQHCTIGIARFKTLQNSI